MIKTESQEQGDVTPKFFPKTKIIFHEQKTISTALLIGGSPPAQHFKSIKEEAEDVYFDLMDHKSKTFSESTKQVCNFLKIEADSLLPGQLSTFYNKLKDKEMAKIHLKYYQRRRIKNLLRIQKHVDSQQKEKQKLLQNKDNSLKPPRFPPTSATTQSKALLGSKQNCFDLQVNTRNTSSPQVKMFTSDQPLSKSVTALITLQPLMQKTQFYATSQYHPKIDMEKKYEENYLKLDQINALRQKRLKIVNMKVKENIMRRKKRASDFNSRQEMVTQKMLNYNERAIRSQSTFKKTPENINGNIDLNPDDQDNLKINFLNHNKSQMFFTQSSTPNPSKMLQKLQSHMNFETKTAQAASEFDEEEVLETPDEQRTQQMLDKIQQKLLEAEFRAQTHLQSQKLKAVHCGQKAIRSCQSVQTPSKLVTPKEAAIEIRQMDQLKQFISDKRRIDRFRTEQQEWSTHCKLKHMEKQGIKQEKIRQLKLQQIKSINEEERKLDLDSLKRSSLHNEMASNANRQLSLKKEDERLRSVELKEYKRNAEAEKKFKLMKVYSKHKNISQNLQNRKDAVNLKLKALEETRKERLIQECQVKDQERARQIEIEQRIIAAKKKVKYLAMLAARE